MAEERLYLTTREEWRAWLERNHSRKREVWLVYFKKGSGRPTIPYGDAVEEALCFGWIDGKVRSIDDERYMQRYTPRRAGSTWSQSNMRRARKMMEEGRMAGAGLRTFMGRKPEAVAKKRYRMPADLKAALSGNRKAKENFAKFPPSTKKHYLWWIEGAKKEETRKRRIREVVLRASADRKPGE